MVLLVLVVKWVMIKPSKPYSNCTSSQPDFTRRQASSYRTTPTSGETLATIISYTCWRQVDRLQYLFQQQEQNPYKKETLWKLHCVKQAGCWYSAWCCWCCTFFTTRTQEESKQSVPFQSTTLREKDWRQNLCSKSIVCIAKPPDTHLFQQLCQFLRKLTEHQVESYSRTYYVLSYSICKFLPRRSCCRREFTSINPQLSYSNCWSPLVCVYIYIGIWLIHATGNGKHATCDCNGAVVCHSEQGKKPRRSKRANVGRLSLFDKNRQMQ